MRDDYRPLSPKSVWVKQPHRTRSGPNFQHCDRGKSCGVYASCLLPPSFKNGKRMVIHEWKLLMTCFFKGIASTLGFPKMGSQQVRHV